MRAIRVQVSRLLEVQQLVPPSSGATFRSLAELMRYFHATGMQGQPDRRRLLAARWQQLLDGLPRVDGAPPPDFHALLERLSVLAQKPAQVTRRRPWWPLLRMTE